MEDVVTALQAAKALGTTPPTVRKLLVDGRLKGEKEVHGTRFHWKIDGKSVARFLSEHGRFAGGPGAPPRIRGVQTAVERLERRVSALEGGRSGDAVSQSALASERDDLRARVVALEERVAGLNEAADLHRAADTERSRVVEHLLAANEASERADALRRQAIAVLEEALAGFSRPGHAGSI
jgi:hypothetical protein